MLLFSTSVDIPLLSKLFFFLSIALHNIIVQWGRILIRFYKMNSLLSYYEAFQEFLVEEQPIYPPNSFDIWCSDFISSTSYLLFSPLAWSVSYLVIYIIWAFFIDPACLTQDIAQPGAYRWIYNPENIEGPLNSNNHTWFSFYNYWDMAEGFFFHRTGLEINIAHRLHICYSRLTGPQELIDMWHGFKSSSFFIEFYPFFSKISLCMRYDFIADVFSWFWLCL